MKKILIAEDELSLAGVIADSLKRKGFAVKTAENGLEAIKQVHTEAFDLYILDVMMPKLSGWDVAGEIRKHDPDTPILFLTAKTGKEDLIKGYGAGGNDYLRKPFHFEELLLRIKELLNRVPEPAVSENIQVGRYIFNPVRQELSFQNETENLSYKENELLKELVRSRGEVLDRKKVLLRLWGDDDFFSTRNMDAYISRLRKKFKKDPAVSILNIRGLGYKLVT
ncbi:response regulator transcription factor [Leadbetterella sp. DM7]|uniref:response regulator transcription factor n=1 Tax=Leadbetterella sp. DM7 TaxID=3235085 RepID=UPI00349EF539